MAEAERDNPGVLVFPPVLVAGTLGIGLLLQWLRPWKIPITETARTILAAALLTAAAALGLWGQRTMHGAGTNIDPRKPATAVVTSGPFRFTRNPLYLFLLGLYLGVTVAVATVWPLLFLVPVFLVLHFGVVRREERYLEAKFGEPYRAYTARVGRWL
jgi:protein-S-isoprenylcysteine O-methyltransferase Ste14